MKTEPTPEANPTGIGDNSTPMNVDQDMDNPPSNETQGQGAGESAPSSIEAIINPFAEKELKDVMDVARRSKELSDKYEGRVITDADGLALAEAIIVDARKAGNKLKSKGDAERKPLIDKNREIMDAVKKPCETATKIKNAWQDSVDNYALEQQRERDRITRENALAEQEKQRKKDEEAQRVAEELAQTKHELAVAKGEIYEDGTPTVKDADGNVIPQESPEEESAPAPTQDANDDSTQSAQNDSPQSAQDNPTADAQGGLSLETPAKSTDSNSPADTPAPTPEPTPEPAPNYDAETAPDTSWVCIIDPDVPIDWENVDCNAFRGYFTQADIKKAAERYAKAQGKNANCAGITFKMKLVKKVK